MSSHPRGAVEHQKKKTKAKWRGGETNEERRNDERVMLEREQLQREMRESRTDINAKP